ncbi:uncharacterized protein N7482_003275 [Penicillium canariense]|uniref:Uncharacterized protein n=1 Tax=Penicillium canariense TaxID=189055 RepID=A0A9W9LP00_9EURO|nr:uncharacterized protein N7482_003275 [Penicillium canariense]KAJ5167681.1 hypothetical protein N7482_003275 [Penicillium canariense]
MLGLPPQADGRPTTGASARRLDLGFADALAPKPKAEGGPHGGLVESCFPFGGVSHSVEPSAAAASGCRLVHILRAVAVSPSNGMHMNLLDHHWATFDARVAYSSVVAKPDAVCRGWPGCEELPPLPSLPFQPCAPSRAGLAPLWGSSVRVADSSSTCRRRFGAHGSFASLSPRWQAFPIDGMPLTTPLATARRTPAINVVHVSAGHLDVKTPQRWRRDGK